MNNHPVKSIEIILEPDKGAAALIHYADHSGVLTVGCKAENAYDNIQQLASLADLFGHLSIRFHQEVALHGSPPPCPRSGNYGEITEKWPS